MLAHILDLAWCEIQQKNFLDKFMCFVKNKLIAKYFPSDSKQPSTCFVLCTYLVEAWML